MLFWLKLEAVKAHVGGESRQEEVGDELEIHLLDCLIHATVPPVTPPTRFVGGRK